MNQLVKDSELQPRKGMTFTPMPENATEVVAAVTVTKKTKWLKRKYQVLHVITKDAVYEYK